MFFRALADAHSSTLLHGVCAQQQEPSQEHTQPWPHGRLHHLRGSRLQGSASSVWRWRSELWDQEEWRQVVAHEGCCGTSRLPTAHKWRVGFLCQVGSIASIWLLVSRMLQLSRQAGKQERLVMSRHFLLLRTALYIFSRLTWSTHKTGAMHKILLTLQCLFCSLIINSLLDLLVHQTVGTRSNALHVTV